MANATLLERIQHYRQTKESIDAVEQKRTEAARKELCQKIINTEMSDDIKELLSIANEANAAGINLDMFKQRADASDSIKLLTAAGTFRYFTLADPANNMMLTVNSKSISAMPIESPARTTATPSPNLIQKFIDLWPAFKGALYEHINDELQPGPAPKFDVAAETDHIINWIRNIFKTTANPGAKAVIGISGGKDSTVCAKLLTEALGPDRVIGVLMPNGEQKDIQDAKNVIRRLGIQGIITNIKPAVDNVRQSIESARDALTGLPVDLELSEDAEINLPPRIRMATLYAIAQSVAKALGGRVCNTCNLSEDWIGYSTKYGDSAGDFAPLAQYTVTEVQAIGTYLGLPDKLVYKTPSDGLCGLSDEEKIGFKYAVLDWYLRTGICDDVEVKAKIDRMHILNLHKLQVIPSCDRLAA